MPINSIVLIGAGGHAKVVADALLKSGRQRSEIIVLDPAEARIGTSIVGPEVAIDRGCIVNRGAAVDHDVAIDGFCHVAPGTTLDGAVRLGASVLVGSGANMLPGVTIGANTVVGARSVVLNSLPPDAICAAVPEKKAPLKDMA